MSSKKPCNPKNKKKKKYKKPEIIQEKMLEAMAAGCLKCISGPQPLGEQCFIVNEFS